MSGNIVYTIIYAGDLKVKIEEYIQTKLPESRVDES